MRRFVIICLAALPFIGGRTFAVGDAGSNYRDDAVTIAQTVRGTTPSAQKGDSTAPGAGHTVTADSVTQQQRPSRQPRPRPGTAPKPATVTRPPAEQGEGDRKVVDFNADIMRPIPVGDSSALNLLGNVIFYHNGAVITCDSAVRYSEKRMECFGRVIINQKTTYVYGDRADYNGELNLATVYAPIVKMVDEDATLYTYNFSFNTLDKIGIYSGGATMSQKDNLMESKRGYYYVDKREFIGVDQVELKNPDYRMRSDSAAYNLDTEVAFFFVKTYIWNEKGEILSADHGNYAHQTKDYSFVKNAYIITEDQEIWADSMDYNSETENALLKSNIQIRDEDQKVMGFGDFGRYWGDVQNGLLTRDPSLLSFDPQEPDTLYVRADSMFFYTFDRDVVFETSMSDDGDQKQISGDDGELILPGGMSGGDGEDGLVAPKGIAGGADRSKEALSLDNVADRMMDSIRRLSEGRDIYEPREVTDTIPAGTERFMQPDEKSPEMDSLDRLTAASSGLDAALRSAKMERDAEKKAKAEAKAARDSVRKAEKDAARAAKEAEKAAKAAAKKRPGKDTRETDAVTGDTTIISRPDSTGLAGADDTQMVEDSLLSGGDGVMELDSLGNPVVTDSIPAIPADSTQQDSLQRVMYGYNNVKIYREDFQAVCDSLVGFSIDSTLHLYINPVLWNGANQIKSDIMDIFTKNEQLDKAIFRGEPFMSSEVDTTMYNQIKGKVMEAYFRDNDIYRNDVIGNGQTYYYMEDDKTKELMGFLVAECADITFLIEERQMDKIIYRGSPIYSIYPMDKIPPTQDQFLPGFKWEGARRPMSKEDVFNRVIRPSEREVYEQLPEPAFPLTDAIILDKENMIKQRIWTERNDRISPEAEEFIRSVELR